MARSGWLSTMVLTGMLAAVLGPATGALANGRLPASSRVIPHPNSPDVLAIQATFGVVLTSDGGQTWQWICEQGVGYTGTYDPFVVLTPESLLVSILPTGLRISTDGGCSFTDAKGLEKLALGDLQLHPDGATVVAATAEPDAKNAVYVSTDAGRSFVASALTAATGEVFTAVRISAQDPSVWVASAWRGEGKSATLYRSADGGKSWKSAPLLFEKLTNLVLLDIDPADPAVLYAKGAESDIPGAGETVLRSADQGASWQPLVTVTTTDNAGNELTVPITGFVAEEDGTLWVGTEQAGLRRSVDGGKTWQEVTSSPRSRCLGRRGSTIYSCGVNFTDGFSVGSTSDDGMSFTPVFRFQDVVGVLDCSPDSDVAQGCAPLYPALADQLRAEAGADGGPGDAGAGGGREDGGVRDDRGDAGGGDGGCAVAPATAGAAAGTTLLLCAALLLLGGRRRASRR